MDHSLIVDFLTLDLSVGRCSFISQCRDKRCIAWILLYSWHEHMTSLSSSFHDINSVVNNMGWRGRRSVVRRRDKGMAVSPSNYTLKTQVRFQFIFTKLSPWKYKNGAQQLAVYNGHFCQLPRVSAIDKFDCTSIIIFMCNKNFVL